MVDVEQVNVSWVRVARVGKPFYRLLCQNQATQLKNQIQQKREPLKPGVRWKAIHT